jgi:hypothetical protein
VDYAAVVEIFFAPAPDLRATIAPIAPEAEVVRVAEVEAATDRAQDDLLAAIGNEVDEVASRLDAWSQRCIETGSFPVDPRKRAAG